MPRPTKERRVGYIPQITYFKPAGTPLCGLQEVTLSVEEVEAIRLKDLEGLMQEEAAQRMQVSRATYQRVLNDARRKISDALITGKAIRIDGGDYRLVRKYRCASCNEEFQELDENGNEAEQCPECGTPLDNQPQ